MMFDGCINAHRFISIGILILLLGGLFRVTGQFKGLRNFTSDAFQDLAGVGRKKEKECAPHPGGWMI